MKSTPIKKKVVSSILKEKTQTWVKEEVKIAIALY